MLNFKEIVYRPELLENNLILIRMNFNGKMNLYISEDIFCYIDELINEF